MQPSGRKANENLSHRLQLMRRKNESDLLAFGAVLLCCDSCEDEASITSTTFFVGIFKYSKRMYKRLGINGISQSVDDDGL